MLWAKKGTIRQVNSNFRTPWRRFLRITYETNGNQKGWFEIIERQKSTFKYPLRWIEIKFSLIRK